VRGARLKTLRDPAYRHSGVPLARGAVRALKGYEEDDEGARFAWRCSYHRQRISPKQ